ncbi:MAG: hypothetical protein CFH01_00394 [Alphaproteobacteria bacterium MarineAlpha2_Bin1]|nr:MAG: hypothetical protein CFH01_00394 [Alphaproteobacteria bacterium MarineAlpha2_Bin1]|tara:strand:+ start:274 stop:666 length:393 start_codon:yes stop_codon:yes gene_type:complete
MDMLNLNELEDIAVNKYFGNVDKKNLEGVLSSLNSDISINIVTDHLTHTGLDEVSKMLLGYFENYNKLWHGNFRSIIDEKKQSIVLKFDWKINDKNNKEDSGSNVNVFYFEKNKISKIWIYMSTQDNPLK